MQRHGRRLMPDVLQSLPQTVPGPQHKVVRGVHGVEQMPEATGNTKAVGFSGFKMKAIAFVCEGHDRFEQVITIGPLPHDMQGKVDLCRRKFKKARLLGGPFLVQAIGKHQDFLSGAAGAGATGGAGSVWLRSAVVAFGSSGARPFSIFSLTCSRLISSPSEISARFHW